MSEGGSIHVVGASWAHRASPIVAELDALTEPDVLGLGHSGERLTRWAERTDAPPEGTSVIVLEMGGNTFNVTPDDVRGVHRHLSSRGASVVWVLPPIWPRVYSEQAARVATLRDRMRSAILASGVPVVRHKYRPTPGHLRDYAHLNRAGGRAFARAIVDGMKTPAAMGGVLVAVFGAAGLLLALRRVLS